MALPMLPPITDRPVIRVRPIISAEAVAAGTARVAHRVLPGQLAGDAEGTLQHGPDERR